MNIFILENETSSKTIIQSVLTELGYPALDLSKDETWEKDSTNATPQAVIILDWKSNPEILRKFNDKFEHTDARYFYLVEQNDIPKFTTSPESKSSDFITKPLNSAEFKLRLEKALQSSPENFSFQFHRLAAMSEVLKSIAHDINNPLAIVSGTTQQLERMVKDGELNATNAKNLFERMDRSLNRITTLVKGLGIITRISTTEEPKETLLGKTLEPIIPFVKERLGKNAINVRANLDSTSEAKILCPPFLIGHIMLALFQYAQEIVGKNAKERWVNADSTSENSKLWLKVSFPDENFIPLPDQDLRKDPRKDPMTLEFVKGACDLFSYHLKIRNDQTTEISVALPLLL